MRITFSSSADYGPQGYERRGENLMTASRADLHWYYFLGSFQITRAEVDISPPWNWVPLFDLIYSLLGVIALIEKGQTTGRIDFTENDEVIKFTLSGRELHMFPTYASSELICPAGEFVSAVHEFVRRELRRLAVEYPSLMQNDHVVEIAQSVGGMEPQTGPAKAAHSADRASCSQSRKRH